MNTPPPSSTLFPYTTLFRSESVDIAILCVPTWKLSKGYPRNIICRTRPRHIIASHYDNFFQVNSRPTEVVPLADMDGFLHRSEEHTSELQSLAYLVCRLLLE